MGSTEQVAAAATAVRLLDGDEGESSSSLAAGRQATGEKDGESGVCRNKDMRDPCSTRLIPRTLDRKCQHLNSQSRPNIRWTEKENTVTYRLTSSNLSRLHRSLFARLDSADLGRTINRNGYKF